VAGGVKAPVCGEWSKSHTWRRRATARIGGNRKVAGLACSNLGCNLQTLIEKAQVNSAKFLIFAKNDFAALPPFASRRRLAFVYESGA
jgi:hypothetical protein